MAGSEVAGAFAFLFYSLEFQGVCNKDGKLNYM